VIIRDDLHGLFNLLVALIFETLAVAILACINTTTEVVILRRWRWGPKRKRESASQVVPLLQVYIPVAICWHHIIDS